MVMACPPQNQKRQAMKNLLKKQSDTQIIAHSVLQKHYAQIRGLQASQSGQRRSLHNEINLLHLNHNSPTPMMSGVDHG